MSARQTPETFLERVDRSGGPDACHPWTGVLDRDGYAHVRWGGPKQLAHRVAFLIAHGRWPEPCALHRCDNPPCCNDRHLFEGTQVENIADMDAKGRRITFEGERHPRAKLTDQDIRANYALCRVTQRQLAARYGVGPSQISSIINGHSRANQASRSN